MILISALGKLGSSSIGKDVAWASPLECAVFDRREVASFYKLHLFLLLKQESQLEKTIAWGNLSNFLGDTFPVSVGISFRAFLLLIHLSIYRLSPRIKFWAESEILNLYSFGLHFSGFALSELNHFEDLLLISWLCGSPWDFCCRVCGSWLWRSSTSADKTVKLCKDCFTRRTYFAS